MEYFNLLGSDLLQNDLLEDEIEVLEFAEFGFPKNLNKRPDHFNEMDELGFFRRFRMYKQTFLNVLERIEGILEYPDDRNNSLSPMEQLLCTLRCYSGNGHLIEIADFMNIHYSTASRVIARTTRAICSLFPDTIKFVEQPEWLRMQNLFYDIAKFPRAIGLIDGTHIRMRSPGGINAEVFRNRKGYFSFNVQCVTDANLKFMDLVARWPGSTHDATILANSVIKGRFEAGHFPGCILIGDSGYPLSEYLITPLANPLTRAEQLYNESHIRTRNLIERQNGIWKRRFPILAYGIRLKKIHTIMAVIVATAVLHNIIRDMNEPEPPLPNEIHEDELNYLIETEDINIDAMNEVEEPVRVRFVQNEFLRYFAQL